MVLVLICNFETSFLLITRLLTDGDVETNPGPPYHIIKLIKLIMASFHQANSMFGITAGMQCACSALFSLCWSKMKNICHWNATDLDDMLIKGDDLFKNLKVMRHLSVNDLPKTITLDNCDMKITFKPLVTCVITKTNVNFIRPSLVLNKLSSDGMMLFVGDTTLSLLWNTKSFYLFDSHSRDEQGMPTANGTGVLMQFSKLSDVQTYIIECYLTSCESKLVQIQYITIKIDASEEASSVATKSNCNKRKLERNSVIVSETHQHKLKLRREIYAVAKGIKNANSTEMQDIDVLKHASKLKQRREKYAAKKSVERNDKNCRIKIFKQSILEGPYYICVVCNRCLYKRSVISFNHDVYDIRDPEFYFYFIQSYDKKSYICHTSQKNKK